MRLLSKTGRRARAAVLLAVLGGLVLGPGAFPAHSAAAASGGAEKTGGGQWKFSREISVPEAAPYYELYLDEAVYRSAAEDLRDLRIQDSTGAPVPYYRRAEQRRWRSIVRSTPRL